MQLPKRKSQALRACREETDAYLTAEEIGRLREEADRLERKVRPKAVDDLSAAREMGDLSENAAYQMAKGRLFGLDCRLAEIRERLKSAVVIEKGADSAGRAKIGSTVAVSVGGRERTFEITGSQEANPGAGRISRHSPVGRAILGRRAGETAVIETADGRQMEYRILSVG